MPLASFTKKSTTTCVAYFLSYQGPGQALELKWTFLADEASVISPPFAVLVSHISSDKLV